MDDDGGMGIRNWGYYEQSLKGNLGLQLMSSVPERDVKPLLSTRGDAACMIPSNGAFLHRGCGIPETQVPLDFVRDSWISQREKLLHVLPNNHNYPLPSSEPSGMHQPLHVVPQPGYVKEERVSQIDDMSGKRDGPLKTRSNGRVCKASNPKPKKPKKIIAPKDETNVSAPRAKPVKKNTGMVINGIDMDIAGLPIPVCSCTGTPQQCYKWGIGGWQSACCTTNMSIYPLPMSAKRRGARIAGRKMSQGAFKKVLEKLLSEGHNLSIPIDLRTHWAKHGTNKFVTIR